MQTVVPRLEEASTFVGVARFICEHIANKFDGATAGVALHRNSGGPYVLVDTFSLLLDDYRLATVHESRYLENPIYDGLRDHGGHAASSSIDGARLSRLLRSEELVHPFVAPLLDATGLVGSIQVWTRAPYPAALEREAVGLATRASVRLSQLGVSAVTRMPAKLTARQHEIARLVAIGDTNGEIGGKLAISANTVKAQLKDIFERLAIHNRVELVAALSREAPPLGVPAGVTRTNGITITRAP